GAGAGPRGGAGRGPGPPPPGTAARAMPAGTPRRPAAPSGRTTTVGADDEAMDTDRPTTAPAMAAATAQPAPRLVMASLTPSARRSRPGGPAAGPPTGAVSPLAGVSPLATVPPTAGGSPLAGVSPTAGVSLPAGVSGLPGCSCFSTCAYLMGYESWLCSFIGTGPNLEAPSEQAEKRPNS